MLTTVLQVCAPHSIPVRLQLAAYKAINKWVMNSMRPKIQFSPHLRCANKTLIAPAQTQRQTDRVPVSCLILCFISASTSWIAQSVSFHAHRKGDRRIKIRLNDLIGGILFPSIPCRRNKAAAPNITPASTIRPLSAIASYATNCERR